MSYDPHNAGNLEKQPKTLMWRIDDAAMPRRRQYTTTHKKLVWRQQKKEMNLIGGNTNIILRSSGLNQRIL